MLEYIINQDQQLFLQLNNLGTANWDSFWMIVTNKKTWIPLYVIFLYLCYQQFGLKNLIIIILLVAIMVGLNESLTNALKEDWVKRLRPCYNQDIYQQMRLVKDSCGGKFGFTSAHASNHFAVAIFLGSLFKTKYKLLLPSLIFWAMLVAYSRVYIGVHFPLDIICGAIIGILFGLFFYFLYNKSTKKLNQNQNKKSPKNSIF